ncbi:SDR family NAD(P)-dependent oxidoreductase [Flavobacterium oreochromis]|uniref:SDR family NAD(P)-dependent oxidoreductase n=1 Tax=Flavobacterium oreochromis TaxID=2906078 RepID=UPI00385A4B0E
MENNKYTGLEVAIVGMSCKFPGAENYEEYWNNILNGVESVSWLTNIELDNKGILKDVYTDENYVKTYRQKPEKKYFDYKFFNYSFQEALLLAPQYRLLHQLIWEALEDSNLTNSSEINEFTSLFVGMEEDFNWKIYTSSIIEKLELDDFTFRSLTNVTHIPSLISNKFNFNGKSLSINTSCSSSLVAIDMALKSLLLGETNIAIAGGTYIKSSPEYGYLYDGKSVESSDGKCRPFDKKADGTAWGEGVGIVVLKRLKDAIAHGDTIHAVIKGSFVNNNGNRKVNHTSPSVKGQSECILKTYKMFSVKPETISYIETHGTGTSLGDPIEIESLSKISFSENTPIGSVKANIGHLNVLSGVASLIKSVLCLKHRIIPPQLHFNEPNPKINFARTPFYVNKDLLDFKDKNYPIRIGINNFGLTGVNAHLILEEYVGQTKQQNLDDAIQVMALSAKSIQSLNGQLTKIKAQVEKHNYDLTALVKTFNVHRKHFDYRKTIAFNDKIDLINTLESPINGLNKINNNNKIVFCFAGQGTQFLNMGKNLASRLSVFKKEIDKGLTLISTYTAIDFKQICWNTNIDELDIDSTHPLILLFQHAMACQMIDLGIKPQALIGHSLGEYAAAVIAEVMTLEDALKIVYERAKLIKKTVGGTMISVSGDSNNIKSIIEKYKVSFASINTENNMVLSGIKEDIKDLMIEFKEKKIPYIQLNSSYAFHSNALEPIYDAFQEYLQQFNFNAPQLPFYSSLSGNRINEIKNSYWADQMLNPVNLYLVISNFQYDEKSLFVDIGPGSSIAKLIKANINKANVISLNKENEEEWETFIKSVGLLWEVGLPIDWSKIYTSTNKIPFSNYCFDPLELPAEVDAFKQLMSFSEKPKDYYVYKKIWKKQEEIKSTEKYKTIVHFSGNKNLQNFFKNKVEKIIEVKIGTKFEKVNDSSYVINPIYEDDFYQLFKEIYSDNRTIDAILHSWTLEETTIASQAINIYYKSLAFLVRQLDKVAGNSRKVCVSIISSTLFKTTEEIVNPFKALLLGVARVSNVEFKNIQTKVIDIDDLRDATFETLYSVILQNVKTAFAIRKQRIYIEQLEEKETGEYGLKYRKNGLYLVTGGYGGIGYTICSALSKAYAPQLIIIGTKGDNETKRKELENLGAEVFYIQSDLSNKQELEKSLENLQSLLNKSIQGVFHTAGLGDFAGIILRRDINDIKLFTPKVFGTINLSECLNQDKLDFFINFSSKAATVTYPGQLAYTAANLFIESFTENTNEKYFSIAWPAIKDVGMAHNAMLNDRVSTAREQENIDEIALDPLFIFKIISNILLVKEQKCVISKSKIEFVQNDFEKMLIDQSQHISIEKNTRQSLNINTELVLPKTKKETQILSIIQEVLNLDVISMSDNFYDLGGNSLSSMVILNRIKVDLGVELTLNEFLEISIISDMAKKITSKNKKEIIID